MRAHLLLAGIISLSGCASLNPTLDPAEAPTLVSPDSWKNGQSAPVPPTGDWVQTFNDPVMASLIDEALANNPDLRATYARVEAARANAEATYGRSLPSIGAGGRAAASRNVTEVGGEPVNIDAPSYRISARPLQNEESLQ